MAIFTYTNAFHTILWKKNHSCKVVKINLLIPRHSFHFEQVQFQLMRTLLSYTLDNLNADGQMDRQMAFCFYIIDL